MEPQARSVPKSSLPHHGGQAAPVSLASFAAVIAALMLALPAAGAPVERASGSMSTRLLAMPAATTTAAPATRGVVEAAHGKPGGWFPSGASPRDGLIFLLVVDKSCDETSFARAELKELVFAAATTAAWHEGDFGVAGMRNNSIVELEFDFAIFRSSKESDEAVRRDLWRQRNNVPIDRFVRHIEGAARGPCRTDGLEGLKQVQAELSSRGAGTRPVLVAMVSNGVVVARGVNFRKPQPEPKLLVRQLQAAGLVARLPKVRLIFAGIGRTWGIGSKKQNWLNSFWRQYAEAAGAHPFLVRSADALITRIRGGS